MPWVPLISSGISWELANHDPDSVSVVGDNIVGDCEQGQGNIFVLLVGPEYRLRATFLSYQADSPGSGWSYTPPQFAAEEGDFPNTAPPYGGDWTGSNVSSWQWAEGSPPEMHSYDDRGQYALGYSSAGGDEPGGDWTTVAERFTLLVEVWVDGPEGGGGEDMSRASRAYVSAYTRDRVHQTVLFAQERRGLVADFTGAIPAGRTITQAVWEVRDPYSATIDTGNITQGRTSVMLTARTPGTTSIRCQITLDNGAVYTQMFVVIVKWSDFWDGNNPTGQQKIVVVA